MPHIYGGVCLKAELIPLLLTPGRPLLTPGRPLLVYPQIRLFVQVYSTVYCRNRYFGGLFFSGVVVVTREDTLSVIQFTLDPKYPELLYVHIIPILTYW